MSPLALFTLRDSVPRGGDTVEENQEQSHTRDS